VKLTIKPLVLSTATFGLMLGVAQNAQAATITPTMIMQTGLPSDSGWDLNNTINGAGLSGGNHALSTSTNAWRSTSTADLSVTMPMPRVTFEFVTSYNFSGLTFWNLGGDSTLSAQGIKDVTIEASNNNGTSWTTLTTTSFAAGGAGPTISGEQITFSSPVQANRVRFIGLSRQGGGNTGGIGFSEVQFQGTAIPEPSSLLALLAFGLAGVGLRKRV
jgi:hypothetical protein